MLHPTAHANKSFLADRGRESGERRIYRVFGQRVAATGEWPGLSPTEETGGAVDVVLCRGKTPDRLAGARVTGACFEAGPGEFLIWRDGVARFHVRGAREIVVEASPTADAERLVTLLLSAPWAARSLLAGLLPLHASAVVTPAGAVAFLGGASAGKSEIAAACYARGWGVLADDLAVLRIDENGVAVLPGPARVQLWPAVAGQARRVLDCGEHAPSMPQPLTVLYVLDRGAAEPATRVTGAAAVGAVLDGVYRPAFVRGLGLERQVLAQAAALAKSTRVMHLAVPDGGDPRELVARVEEELA